MRTSKKLMTMKYIAHLLTFVSILVFVACESTDIIRHYEEYGLNCPVKSIQVFAYEAESKFGEVIKGDLEWDGHYLAVFDSIGNIDTISTFDDDGDLQGIQKFTYDAGLLVSVSHYDEDGELEFQSNNEYVDGYVSKSTSTEHWRETPTVRVSEFKRNGRWMIEETFFKDGVFQGRAKYTKHDAEGAKWVAYNEKGELDTWSSGFEEYNKDGRVVKYGNNSFTGSVEYNKSKLPIYLNRAALYHNQVVFTRSEEDIYYIDYEYDDKGNWIKQIVFQGETKKPINIYERIIVY